MSSDSKDDATPAKQPEPSTTEAEQETTPQAPPAEGSSSSAQPAQEESAPPAEPQDRSLNKTPAANNNNNDDSPDARETKVRFSNRVSIADLVFSESPSNNGNIVDDACERLYEDGLRAKEERQRKMDATRELNIQKELEDVTFKPKIPDHGIAYEDFDQFHAAQVEWTRRRKKIFDDKVRKMEKEKMEDITFSTKMTPKSKKIIANMKKEQRYVGPVKGWDVHFNNFVSRMEGQQEMFLCEEDDDDDGMRSEYTAAASNDGSQHHQQHTGRSAGSTRKAFTPRISPHASRRANASHGGADGSHGQGNVFDKLYEDSILRTAAQRVVEKAKIEKESQELFKPVTNESLWHLDSLGGGDAALTEDGYGLEGDEYSFNDGASSMGGASFRRDPNEVVESLLLKGEEYKHRREERAKKHAEANKDELTFKPKTNKHSRALIHKYVTQAPQIVARPALRDKLSPDVKGIKEKPLAKFDVDLFWSRMERNEAIKAQKIEQKRAAKEVDEVTECTFRPSITKASERYHQRAYEGTSGYTQQPQQRTPKMAVYQQVPQRHTSTHSAAPAPAATSGANVFYADDNSVASSARTPNMASAQHRQPQHSAASRGSTTGRGAPQQHNSSPPTARAFFADSTTPPSSIQGYGRGGSSSAERDASIPTEDTYLNSLENELRGVIADWQNISDE